MRCPSCSRDLPPTAYGRCPVCGAVVQAEAAAARDAAALRRARASDVSDPHEGGGCATGCMVLLGIPALVVCGLLIDVGQRNHWSSDGPGILVVMIGVAVSGLVALSCLGGALLAQVPGVRRVAGWLDD